MFIFSLIKVVALLIQFSSRVVQSNEDETSPNNDCGALINIKHANKALSYQICQTNKDGEIQLNILNDFQATALLSTIKPQLAIHVIGKLEETFTVDDLTSYTRYQTLLFDSHTISKLLKLIRGTRKCIKDSIAPQCQKLARILEAEGRLLNIFLEDQITKYLIDVDGMKAEMEGKSHRNRRNADTTWCPGHLICHGRTNVTAKPTFNQNPPKSFTVKLDIKKVVPDGTERKRRSTGSQNQLMSSPRKITFNYFSQLDEDGVATATNLQEVSTTRTPVSKFQDISKILEILQQGLTSLKFIKKIEQND